MPLARVFKPSETKLSVMYHICRMIRIYQWPHGHRRGSATARLLGLRVRIPPEASMSVSCSVLCDVQVEVSLSGWSPVQRSPTVSGVSMRSRTSTMRPWSTMSRRVMKKIFKIQFVPRSKQITFRLKTNQLIVYRTITTVSSEIHEKYTNALCGQNVKLSNVKYGGT
jgi:hypothetical protein